MTAETARRRYSRTMRALRAAEMAGLAGLALEPFEIQAADAYARWVTVRAYRYEMHRKATAV